MKDTVLPFERLRATVFKGTRPQKSAYLILGTPAFQLIIWGVKMAPSAGFKGSLCSFFRRVCRN
jgi:hypothetical protein